MNTFGLSATDLSPQDLLALAESCHNVNRAYVLATATPAPLESQDPATLPWEELDKAGRDVALEGVVFHVKNPDATPAASHANWMRAKQAQGWRYGKTKDVATKRHPCLLPWAQLPKSQRVKDMLFIAAIENGLRLLDFARNNQ